MDKRKELKNKIQSIRIELDDIELMLNEKVNREEVEERIHRLNSIARHVRDFKIQATLYLMDTVFGLRRRQ